MVVIFSFIYLLVTVGVPVDVHYCTGEVATVQVFSEANSCCDEDSDCSSNCCHSSSEVIQFEEQQTLLSNYRLNIDLPVAPKVASASIYSSGIFANEGESIVGQAFFPPPNEPVWLLHCSLVYYG